MIVTRLGIGSDGFHPGDIAASISNPKVRRFFGLRYEEALFSKASQKLGFPKSGVKIRCLAVRCPIPIRLRKRKVQLVEEPGRVTMTCARQ